MLDNVDNPTLRVAEQIISRKRYILTLTTRLSGGLTSTSEESEDVSVITVFVTMYCCVRPDEGW